MFYALLCCKNRGPHGEGEGAAQTGRGNLTCAWVCISPADRTHAVQVGPEATVLDVKALIEARQGMSGAGNQLLVSSCTSQEKLSVPSSGNASGGLCELHYCCCNSVCLDVAVGLAASAQRLLFAGRQLEDSVVLAQEGVADEDTLHILARLLGGGKKRKKKTYTKPKKQKHKHKKIKLRVLKFFKVSGRRPCLSTCPVLTRCSADLCMMSTRKQPPCECPGLSHD